MSYTFFLCTLHNLLAKDKNSTLMYWLFNTIGLANLYFWHLTISRHWTILRCVLIACSKSPRVTFGRRSSAYSSSARRSLRSCECDRSPLPCNVCEAITTKIHVIVCARFFPCHRLSPLNEWPSIKVIQVDKFWDFFVWWGSNY